jgi:hypothetical protein
VTTITDTFGVNDGGLVMFILEYKNVKSSVVALDGTANAGSFVPGAGVDAVTTGNWTALEDGNLIISMCSNAAVPASYATIAAGTGFQKRLQEDSAGQYGLCAIEDNNGGNPARGTQSGRWTFTGNFPSSFCIGVAFIDASRMQLPAFPATPILDSAVRADENPLTGWTAPFYPGNATLKIVSNKIANNGPGVGSAYLNRPTCNPEYMEAYMTFDVMNGSSCDICINANPATVDNISLHVEPTLFHIYNIVGNVLISTLRTVNRSVANGDSVGIRRRKTTLEIWHKRVGGVWTLVHSEAFSAVATHLGTRVQITMGDTTQRISAVGGGSYSELHGQGWQTTRGSVGATLNDQPTFKEYTFDDKSVRKDWK